MRKIILRQETFYLGTWMEITEGWLQMQRLLGQSWRTAGRAKSSAGAKSRIVLSLDRGFWFELEMGWHSQMECCQLRREMAKTLAA